MAALQVTWRIGVKNVGLSLPQKVLACSLPNGGLHRGPACNSSRKFYTLNESPQRGTF